MNNTSRSEKQAGQSVEGAGNSQIDPALDFDQWAGAVKQQMLAALKKRERVRSVWS